jgi:hypothetical protein
VKAILEYTAQVYPRYNRLTQGVGFLNARGAVELSRYLADSTQPRPADTGWSHEFIWGNHLVRGGTIARSATAWTRGLTWGAASTSTGVPVSWGILPQGSAWQIACADSACTSASWAGSDPNVVWGQTCGGADCTVAWTTSGAGSALTTSSELEVVVWGSADAEVVVWGSAEAEVVVWGSSGEMEVVVWGSSCIGCEDVVWPRP